MAEQNITPTAEPTPAPTLDGRADMKSAPTSEPTAALTLSRRGLGLPKTFAEVEERSTQTPTTNSGRADMKTPQNSRAGMKPAPTAGGYEIRPYTGNSAPTYDDRAEREQMDWLAQIQKKREALAEQRQKDDAAYQRRADNARKWAAWMDALSAAGNLLWTTRNSGNLRDANASVDKALQARLAEKTAWRDKQRTAMDAAMERATAAQGQIFSARTAAAQRRYQRALADANLAAKNEANRITSQYNADRLRQQKANADRQYELKKQEQESLDKYRQGIVKNGQQRNDIYASRGNSSRRGGNSSGSGREPIKFNNREYTSTRARNDDILRYFKKNKLKLPMIVDPFTQKQVVDYDNALLIGEEHYKNLHSSKSKGNNNGKIKKIPWQHPAGGH